MKTYEELLKQTPYVPSLETVKAANASNLSKNMLADATQRQIANEGYASITNPVGRKTDDGKIAIDASPSANGLNAALTSQNNQAKKSGGSAKTTQSYTVNANNQPYVDQLNSLYDQIMNRKPFQYDLNGDLLYRQMADQYTQLGQQAMRDAMGTAASLTGGYGNSYANQVGNQAYQQYLTALNEQIPNLYDRALNTWMAQGDDLIQQYQLAAAHPEYLEAIKPRTYSVTTEAPAEQQPSFADAIAGGIANVMRTATAGAASPQAMYNYYDLLKTLKK